MTIHAWLVAATGLDGASVWRAYQNSAHLPPVDTDCITYHERIESTPVFLSEVGEIDGDGENLTYTRAGEDKTTYTIRVFGPNRKSNTRKIRGSRYSQTARAALSPLVAQSVGDSTPVREEREQGWIEYLSFDAAVHEMTEHTETVPRVLGSEMDGDLGANEVSVIDADDLPE